MSNKGIIPVSLALLAFGASQNAFSAESDAWQFEIKPYLLAAGLKGTNGVRGVTTDVDLSFGDIWDALDAGFFGMLSARKGRWSFDFDGMYTKLSGAGSKTITGPFGHFMGTGALDLSTEMYIAQGTVGYRVLDGATTVDLMGGLRYMQTDVELEIAITTPVGVVFPGGERSGSDSVSWVDGIVGARVVHPVSNNIALTGYADVGGGGSDLTYQFSAGANWKFKKGYTAEAGYRVLDWDYEDDGTVLDLRMSGPYLGLGISF